MPAVLLEAGVIVNRDEELALSTLARQAAISAAIADAIRKFCGVSDLARKVRLAALMPRW